MICTWSITTTENKVMGLTIHYRLKSETKSQKEARRLVEQLRQRALDLPLKEVDELVELKGDACDFEKFEDEHPHRWMLIQASQHVVSGNCHHPVQPKHLIAFSTWPGDGCEQANFGLCLYPATIMVENDKWPYGKKRIATGLSGWTWGSFCKTQYASNPNCGGVEHFLRCHLSVVNLLDACRDLGILAHASDEGEFYEKRDVEALVKEIGEWNSMIAGWAGRLKDSFGKGIVSQIGKFPNFEHLEAKGRQGEGESAE